jgi:hypothetical protein
VLAVLVLGGCGSNGTKARRDAVNAYFANVTNAQIDLTGQQAQINSALQSFSLTRVSPSELAGLRSARREVDRTLRRVRALQPPRDARRLHGLIEQRIVLQRSVIDELIATELYLPKFAAILAPLHAASVALRRDLAAIATPAPKLSRNTSTLDRYAAAFGGYGDALTPVSAKLDRLVAPPVVRPPLVAEQVALRRSIALSEAIRRAIRRRNIAAANTAIHSLFGVSATLNGIQTRREQAAAAKAYDARLHRIDVLAAKVNLERERLVKLIG